MADTFSNDLRVRLQESGSNAGSWGDLLNGTITNLASALGQGSEAIPNASTHTITLADGTADEARSLYLKCTGGGQACTVTLGPNTISKVWIIDNATSYTLTFSQGSGANVAIAAGAVKVIATDGAGSGAAVVDTLDGLEGSLSSLTVTGTGTMTKLEVNTAGSANAIAKLERETGNTATLNSGSSTGFTIDSDNTNGGNAITRFTQNGSLSLLIDASGSVGVGTSSPFSINGTNLEVSDALYARVILDSTAGTRYSIQSLNDSSLTIYDIDADAERLRIDGATGSVGIGNSIPSSFFSTARNLVVGSGSGSQGITIYSANTNIGNLFFADGTSGTAEYSGYLEYSHASDSLRIGTGGAERIRVTSTGVGVGTSSPKGKINSVLSQADTSSSSDTTLANSFLHMGGGEYGSGRYFLTTYGYSNSATNSGAYMGAVGTSNTGFGAYDLVFGTRSATTDTAPIERMRLDTGGALRINGTTGYFGEKLSIYSSTSYTQTSVRNGTGYAGHIAFRNDNGAVGTIFTNGSVTNYNTSSDQRLKENIADADDAGSKIDAIQVRKYDWKADGSHQDYGMVAQELQAVAPEAVSGDADSEEMMGVDYSKLVPMMLKEIQSLRARINALETE